MVDDDGSVVVPEHESTDGTLDAKLDPEWCSTVGRLDVVGGPELCSTVGRVNGVGPELCSTGRVYRKKSLLA